MGIKGLKKIIKKNAPNSISEINIKDLKGKTICIDSSILLYKFRYIYQSDNFHILGFLNKIIELLEYRVTPVFVFDGKPPDAKKEVLIKRFELRNKQKERIEILLKQKEQFGVENDPEFIDSDSELESELNLESINKLKLINKELEQLQKNMLNVTKKHSDEVMKLLKSIGIPFLIATSEAEEYCAFLQKNKYVDYILTEDTDSLTFGGNNILFNVPKNKHNFYLCNLNLTLEGLKLNYNQFIDFCILCGCDYTCTISKIGPVTALNIIKTYGSIEAFILKNTKYIIPENFNFILARELFNKNNSFPKLLEQFSFKTFNKNDFNEIIKKYSINLNFENKIINLINLFPKKFLEY